MRFLQTNHVETANWLKIIENSSEESSMTRNRALAIRMSLKKFTVKAISLICNITIGTVYIWFDKWNRKVLTVSLWLLAKEGKQLLSLQNMMKSLK